MEREELIEALIDLAIEEDIASGDISTDAIIPTESRAAALMTAKADGVVSGLSVLPACRLLPGRQTGPGPGR